MADHGNIAECLGQLEPSGRVANPLVYPLTNRTIVCLQSDVLPLGSGRVDDDGFPAPPCLRVPRGGSLRFRLGVEAGPRSVSVRVKQPSADLPRPTLRVLANAEVGIATDLIATAPTGASWVRIGPISFTAASAGGVVVELASWHHGGDAGAWWDTIQVA
jgi:hypothetical protein